MTKNIICLLNEIFQVTYLNSQKTLFNFSKLIGITFFYISSNDCSVIITEWILQCWCALCGSAWLWEDPPTEDPARRIGCWQHDVFRADDRDEPQEDLTVRRCQIDGVRVGRRNGPDLAPLLLGHEQNPFRRRRQQPLPNISSRSIAVFTFGWTLFTKCQGDVSFFITNQ